MPETSQSRSWFARLFANSREPVNSLTHAIGALLALIGMIWLIWMARDFPGRAIALAVFGTSMVLLYTASSVMHFYKGSETILHRLNQMDHAAIYLLIAGSYTPFTYTFMVDAPYWRWGMLILIWSLAVIGVVLKLGFNMYGHVSTLFYVLMGWVAVFAIPQWIQLGHTAPMILIAAGGVVYTIGAVIFALRRPNFHQHFGHHELWHLFVMGGSACHFIAAAIWVA
jgi:hemolysin III